MKLSPSLLVLACCAASALAQVDHRRSQSPVKDQGGRGTCAAFAICAALETFPGVPTDLSEQLLYATVKLHENAVDKWLRKLGEQPLIKAGNLLEDYTRLFELVGTSHETFLPYDPDPKKAGPDVPEELRRYLELAQVGEPDLVRLRDGFGKYGLRARDCELLTQAEARDVERLKRELDAGRLAIPVSYALYGPKWATAPQAQLQNGTVIHPGLMWQYRFQGAEEWADYGAIKLLCGAKKLDFVEQVAADRIELKEFPDPDGVLYGGHAVTIVGYDERGFLVKNSWGPWGDAGYCTVLFDYHRLLATRALLIDRVYIRTPSLSPFATTAEIEKARFRLKVQPRGVGPAAQLVLSTWAQEPRDPNVEVVEYQVEVRGKDGAWGTALRRVVRAADPEARAGLPLVVDGVAFVKLLAGDRARVTARYGGPQPVDPARPDAATYVRTLRFEEFAPWPDGARDLQPVE